VIRGFPARPLAPAPAAISLAAFRKPPPCIFMVQAETAAPVGSYRPPDQGPQQAHMFS
jgi:hypothetical protein